MSKSENVQYLRLTALSQANKSITKYRIEDELFTEVWTCGELDKAKAVCTDEQGFIYVGRSNEVYVVSPDGKPIYCSVVNI